jgi:hypothetical protein
MNSAITDVALDLGQFALDNEVENGRRRTQPIVVLEARRARAKHASQLSQIRFRVPGIHLQSKERSAQSGRFRT